VNERQQLIVDTIAELNSSGVYCPSAQVIAHRAGLVPSKDYVLSVTTSLRALERSGVVGRIAPPDRWDSAGWCLKKPDEQKED
jgi:hypothetical protein